MILDILLARMAQIVHEEGRPFSYRDFVSFDHGGISYRFTHGTIRNYISRLRKQDKIEWLYTTTQAFYTLKGVKVGRPVTPNHTGAYSSSYPVLNHSQKRYLYFLLTVPMDKPGIHDFVLTLKVKGLWKVIQMYPMDLVKNIDTKSNRDITIEEVDLGDGIVVNTTIHKTDTVTVRIACTLTPIPLDLSGLSKITKALTQVHERLQMVVDEYLYWNLKPNILSSTMVCRGPIPNCMTWTANMWHFGQDSLTSYSGEMFDMSWHDAQGVFHMYSKILGKEKKVRIRKEIQEYPNKPWIEAFSEKLRLLGDKGSDHFNDEFNKSFGGH